MCVGIPVLCWFSIYQDTPCIKIMTSPLMSVSTTTTHVRNLLRQAICGIVQEYTLGRIEDIPDQAENFQK